MSIKRTFLSGLWLAVVGICSVSLAESPSQPIGLRELILGDTGEESPELKSPAQLCLEVGTVEAQYDLAVEMYYDSNSRSGHSEVFDLLKAASEKGHVRATFRLGSLYLSGSCGAERSFGRAVGCYRTALGLGFRHYAFRPVGIVVLVVVAAVMLLLVLLAGRRAHGVALFVGLSRQGARAQYLAALRYKDGARGVVRQPAEALRLLMASAEQGYAPAQVELGHFFQDGLVVVKSRLKAVEWYEKAARQENADALFQMGQCYETGAGVQPFLAKAYGFYLLGRDAGCRRSVERLDFLKARMPVKQVDVGVQFAREFAEESGFSPS